MTTEMNKHPARVPRGLDVLRDPLLNKGTAFTEKERDALGIRGLLPLHVLNQDDQIKRVLKNLRRLLRHADFGQDHDTFYYKMQFRLIEVMLRPKTRHHIYLDIKDTRSAVKMAKLHDVLCSAKYDGTRDIIARVQTVRSHEVEPLQLADLLIGAVGYANRQLSGNAGKLAIIERLRQRTGFTLTHSTLIRENKFNVFVWRGADGHA